MWEKWKGRFWKKNSIKSKTIWLQVLVMAIILIMNLLIYRQINMTVQRIDAVFSSNVTMNDLAKTLETVQSSVYEYLNTKSTAALEDYYRSAQEYQGQIEKLNSENVDSEVKMLEKNIRNMSETYLDQADQTVQAKRGRNVERYRAAYEDQTQLYQYIKSYMYKLNNQRFRSNSDNYQVLLRIMSTLEIFSIIVMVIVALVCLFVSVLLISSMIEPLGALAAVADKVSGGEFDVEFPQTETNDEVGIVIHAFHKMLDSIKDYIEKQRISMENEARMKEEGLSMEAHLKEAQLKYLQAQINPHFLFNSLNAGAQLAAMEDAEKTGIFVEKMADFFRYNVKKMQGDAYLSEEIESVDNYIYILNVRFAGDIHYEKQIDGEIEDIRVPSMILQPVVENAVTHGIRNQMDDAQILLQVQHEKDQLRITVTDNGAGMTQERIREVLSGKAQETAKEGDSTGIGLDNVIKRLSLYYKREDLFDIYSEGAGKGTEVTILLPLEKGE